jgi:hypothetical protein
MKKVVVALSLPLLPAILTAGIITSASSSIGSMSATQSGTSSAIASIGNSNGSAIGSGAASFGNVSVSTYANCGGVSACSAGASASFSDTLYIFDVSGTLRALVGFGGAFIDGNTATGRADFGVDFVVFGNSTTGVFPSSPRTLTTAFAQGAAIVIGGNVAASAADFAPNDPQMGSSDAELGLNFGNFVVLGLNGLPLSGFRYTSASYHDYGIAGGTFVTPEPGTAWMVPTGVVIVLLCRSGRGGDRRS